MTTSNKIFISFLIFLLSGITALYLGSKYYHDIDDKIDFAIQEKKTAPFSVVVAEPGSILVLKNSRGFSISQEYKKDAVSNLTSFVVRNDTLYMLASKLKIQDKWFTVPEVFCKNVKSIIAKEKAIVTLDKFHADTLSVAMDASRLEWHFGQIAYTRINAISSTVVLEGINLKKIDLQMDKTTFNIKTKKGIQSISGSLKNKSYVDFSLDGKMSLEVDKSSRVYLKN